MSRETNRRLLVATEEVEVARCVVTILQSIFKIDFFCDRERENKDDLFHIISLGAR